MKDNPFGPLVEKQRAAKPRGRGITMVADWGMSLDEQKGVLSVAGPYIDLAKIAVGISALLEPGLLKQKIEVYAEHQATTFPGGQFLEYSVLRNRTDDYMQACVDAGYSCIEVSDNLLDIDLDSKCELIRLAREKYGLGVLGEVGKKEGVAAGNDLAEDAVRCLDAGAETVFLEAADFFSGDVNEKELNRILERCDEDKLIFELPGPWIEGVTLSDVQRITRWLLGRFGMDVNIANVSPHDVVKLEALRLGIGVNAGGSES